MNFKVGDKCKPIFPSRCGNYCDEPMADHIVITNVVGRNLSYDICDKYGKKISDCGGCFRNQDLEIYSSKKEKFKPTLFIVRYEERSTGDPYREMKTRKELDDWLDEAEKEGKVIMNSIKVFEIKGEWKIKTAHTLVKVK